MKTPLKEFQKLVIENYKKENQTKDKELIGFLEMLRCYCIETKTTEMEVIHSEELYEFVYELFNKHRDYVMR
tara:strand:+ start:3232 stop:3447 length:216 start_codon:yes stop_codon:yes gene_type:complete